MQKYINELVKEGYILEDGTPIKCYCGCKDFEEVNKYYENHSPIEFQLKCKKCGNIVGHWSYGYWEV